ncbi:hypothetical protein [Kibdelosporangium phytohabitans]|uniref:Uncharacterized protein n=1 Tax=Kibdelosporangium phytohabitans TaxID=860235 RepID=A0A0N9ID47_9PSEU|nr:hypothetical protein [Kibdelosporangium phytohabitans]ALG14320.1 hypothetical protein AOZ06_52245 [Kibdelosporangium phytohabitans]MBE1466668.1 hypothetical protein [Kibdelosporangium phytohabitans]
MRDQQPPPSLQAVRAVLNEHDPEGLLDLGAPDDEYDFEAEDFVRLLAHGDAIEPAVVVDVWERWFGPASVYVSSATPAEIARLAADLNALR